MKDLLEESQIFEASSRLQSAASALHKVMDGIELHPTERRNMKWSGRFLKEVDQRQSSRGTTSVSGELSVQATDVRPSFYATLFQLQPMLREAGIKAEEEVEAFLWSTYQLLTAGGEYRGERRCDAKTIGLAATFLEELASTLLIRLTGNGAPVDKGFYQLSIA